MAATSKAGAVESYARATRPNSTHEARKLPATHKDRTARNEYGTATLKRHIQPSGRSAFVLLGGRPRVQLRAPNIQGNAAG